MSSHGQGGLCWSVSTRGGPKLGWLRGSPAQMVSAASRRSVPTQVRWPPRRLGSELPLNLGYSVPAPGSCHLPVGLRRGRSAEAGRTEHSAPRTVARSPIEGARVAAQPNTKALPVRTSSAPGHHLKRISSKRQHDLPRVLPAKLTGHADGTKRWAVAGSGRPSCPTAIPTDAIPTRGRPAAPPSGSGSSPPVGSSTSSTTHAGQCVGIGFVDSRVV
jgi:hypothetical protein